MHVFLKVNNETYTEAFNRYLGIDLNLILYVVKFLEHTPTQATYEVYN